MEKNNVEWTLFLHWCKQSHSRDHEEPGAWGKTKMGEREGEGGRDDGENWFLHRVLCVIAFWHIVLPGSWVYSQPLRLRCVDDIWGRPRKVTFSRGWIVIKIQIALLLILACWPEWVVLAVLSFFGLLSHVPFKFICFVFSGFFYENTACVYWNPWLYFLLTHKLAVSNPKSNAG